MKTEYQVEVAFPDIEPIPTQLSLFLEILRYMGHTKPGPSNLPGVMRSVLIPAPKHINDSRQWAESNAQRINTFGKDISAMVVEVQNP